MGLQKKVLNTRGTDQNVLRAEDVEETTQCREEVLMKTQHLERRGEPAERPEVLGSERVPRGFYQKYDAFGMTLVRLYNG